MTTADFLATLPAALQKLDAELLQHTPHLYPRGAMLRVKVPNPPPWLTLPNLLEPLGAVYYAREGRWPGIMEWHAVGVTLGLPAGDVVAIAMASDRGEESLAKEDNGPALVALRRALVQAVEQGCRTG